MAYVAPRNVTEEKLAKIWAGILGVQEIGAHDNFFELGGDSILSIQIISKARQEGLKLTANQLFQNQTIAELASVVDTASIPQSEQGLVHGLVPLTPIQNWFFAQSFPEPHHWNQAGFYQIGPGITYEILSKAVISLIQHHDALRLAFHQQEGQWCQSIAEVCPTNPIRSIDLSAHNTAQLLMLITERAAEEQKSLRLSEGQIFRAVFFDCGKTQASYFLLIIHHLAVDGISWQILLEDLETSCRQLIQNQRVKLPAKTTSFKMWSEKLQAHAQSDAVKQELSYWYVQEHQNADPLPVDIDEGDSTNTVASVDQISSGITKEETYALLHEIPNVYHTKINDILLTALVKAFINWIGKNSLLIGLEGHGREEIVEAIDISRTVGWFTSYFPLFLKLEDQSNPGKSIVAIKEQLRKIPNRGLGFGLLRYVCKDREVQQKMKSIIEPQICFNYLGNLGSENTNSDLFVRTSHPIGQARSTQGTRSYLLEFNAYISNAQFYLRCSYSRNFHRETTIQKLVDQYIQILRELITHCKSPNTGGFSPSDFPESGLNQADLDKFITKITKK